ncbi:MAG: glycosyltransferase family 4 protein [Isosphaeraceae bacterium]|nr:glycosyltransferase family 4 protein [Isosphaeraceae bacterium]
MAKQVVVFSPHSPFPPTGGSHLRCMEMLTALAELGCAVTLVGSTMLSNSRWSTPKAIEFFGHLGIEVELYRLAPFDFEIGRLLKRVYRPMWSKQTLTPRLPSPPGMRRWFTDLLDRRRPDVVWMNYACWDGLLAGARDAALRRTVDTHDLITRNMQMQISLASAIRCARTAGALCAEHCLLDDGFFDGLDWSASTTEFEIYDSYDCTIAISRKEGRIIADSTKKTFVKTIPMTLEPTAPGNTHDDLPIMVLGAHLFNLQGGLFFGHRVLPRLLRKAPGFRCRVTGRVSRDRLMPRSSALWSQGFVANLAPYYRRAQFALCPVFGGTGQQVKIVEAMAHGLAVVALRRGAESSPIRHGINGFLADNAAEFAEHTLSLWYDKDACRRMGEAARETIATEYSRAQLLEDVWEVLNAPSSGRADARGALI